MSSTTAAPKRRKWLRRGVVLPISGLVVLALAGTAFALYLLHAGVGGTLQSRSMTASWSSIVAYDSTTWNTTDGATVNGGGWNGSTIDATGKAPVCTVTRSSGQLTVDAEGYPGDYCSVRGKLKLGAGASEDAKVVGLDFTLPKGWSAMLKPDSSCGATVSKSQTESQEIDIIFQVGSGSATIATDGSSGVKLEPVSQAPSTVSCPTVTGA